MPLKNKFLTQKKIRKIEAIVDSIAPTVMIYDNVIAYPLVNTSIAGFDFQGGLCHSETLNLIEEAVLTRHNKLSQTMSHLTDKSIEVDALNTMKGALLYGGILFNNFGHFLLESLSRLWAYNLFRELDPYILFYAPWGISNYNKKDNYIYQALKGFGIPPERIVILSETVRLIKIIIPEQKYGFGKCRTPGNNFINFIQSLYFPDRLPKECRNADKIYVSRSRLPFNQGRPLGEVIFEKYLQANNYKIIYPEKYTLYEQLSIYKQAKKIIFCDGGATYATILLPHLNAEIAIIARRRDNRWNYKEVTEHFFGYKKNVLWIDEVMGQYQYGLETWDAVAEMDWYKVSRTLKDKKFVETLFEEKDATNLAEIKRKELQSYIQSIHTNPLFLSFMLNLREEYPILPVSFEPIPDTA